MRPYAHTWADSDCSVLLFRYEVNFQNGIDCGGAYAKLLSQSAELNLVKHRTQPFANLVCYSQIEHR